MKTKILEIFKLTVKTVDGEVITANKIILDKKVDHVTVDGTLIKDNFITISDDAYNYYREHGRKIAVGEEIEIESTFVKAGSLCKSLNGEDYYAKRDSYRRIIK